MRLGNACRRSIFLPLLVSIGLHVLGGVVVFWQASQSGRSSETPIPFDAISVEDESGTLDILTFSPSKSGRFPAKGDVEESDNSFVLDVKIEDLPGYQETKEPAPVVHPIAKGANQEGVGARTNKQGSGASGPNGTGSSAGIGDKSLFPTVGADQSIVYLIDRSISMGLSGSLDLAKRQVLQCIESLPDSARFQVIFYTNHQVDLLSIDGQLGLLHATDSIKAKARALINRQQAKDGTQHLEALTTALRLKPKVIVLITDADDLAPDLVKKITSFNEHRCVIHTIELSEGRKGDEVSLLAMLATRNGGKYHRVSPRQETN
jgi:hypothetical protein